MEIVVFMYLNNEFVAEFVTGGYRYRILMVCYHI